MKLRLILGAAILLICLQSATAQTDQSAEEAAVRRVVQRELDGWAKFDAKQVASTYSADAIWQNPFGVRLHGRAQLEKFLNNLFARPGYRSATDTAAPKILDLRLTSPSSAVVWSDEQINGQIDDNTGKPMAPRHSYYLEVLMKINGEWKITDSIIMDLQHQP